MRAVARGGGGVGLRNNLLDREWEEMCRAAYNLDAVTKETKLYWVAASGEAPPTGGKGGRRQGTRGDPYVE